MASNTSFYFFLFFFYLQIFSHYITVSEANKNYGQKNIRGMFVFGSSLVDNGNNNYFQNSLAKANYLPYGADFPLGSSGRFTNGENVIDILGKLMNLPTYIPVFADPLTTGTRILNGVNYASGGSGILDDTGAIAGQVFSLRKQVDNFQNVTIPDLEKQLGDKTGISLANNYLFVVGTGGNDYSFNYFLFKPNVSVEQFTASLTSSLTGQLQRLYNLGARKFVLISINPNGCSPMAMSLNPMNQGCVETVNRAVHLFNSNLVALTQSLKLKMPGSALVFINSYQILRDIIRDPASQGFTDAKTPCCEVTSIAQGGTGTLCRRGGSVCSDRKTKVFFDGLHPTEAVNLIIANKAFSSNSWADVYPFNVDQLSRKYTPKPT